MRVRWANDAETYVRIEDGGVTSLIPADDNHPTYQNIKALIEAGQLTIEPYEPPAPPSPDIQG